MIFDFQNIFIIPQSPFCSYLQLIPAASHTTPCPPHPPAPALAKLKPEIYFAPVMTSALGSYWPPPYSLITEVITSQYDWTWVLPSLHMWTSFHLSTTCPLPWQNLTELGEWLELLQTRMLQDSHCSYLKFSCFFKHKYFTGYCLQLFWGKCLLTS